MGQNLTPDQINQFQNYQSSLAAQSTFSGLMAKAQASLPPAHRYGTGASGTFGSKTGSFDHLRDQGDVSTKFSQSAMVSRKFYTIHVYNNGDAIADNVVAIPQTQYSVDPSNPFFYLFVSAPQIQGNTSGTSKSVAFKTVFHFSNGGTFVSEETIYWGDSACLDAKLGAAVVNVQTGPVGTLYGHDPVSNNCPYAIGGNNDNRGTIIKWTSIADLVTVTTTTLYQLAPGVINLPGSVIHGILQQHF